MEGYKNCASSDTMDENEPAITVIMDDTDGESPPSKLAKKAMMEEQARMGAPEGRRDEDMVDIESSHAQRSEHISGNGTAHEVDHSELASAYSGAMGRPVALTESEASQPVLRLLSNIEKNQIRTNMLLAQSTAAMEEIRDVVHQSAQIERTTCKAITDLVSHLKMMSSINSTIDGSCLTDLGTPTPAPSQNKMPNSSIGHQSFSDTSALSEITAADVTPLHPCRYPEISEHTVTPPVHRSHRPPDGLQYLPIEKIRQLQSKAASKENFCVLMMREIFSEQERLRDANINGLNKPQLSPTFKRIRFILDEMHDTYGRVSDAEIISAEAKAIRAMDTANRTFRSNHIKKLGL